MKSFFTILLVLIVGQSIAQIEQKLDVPFSIDGQVLGFGFNGGTNNPQFARVDVNNDGILDLYYFDKVGAVSMTYLYDGSGGLNYTYAPAYAKAFPDMERFVLLRDYNGDGITDIFALDGDSGGAGLQVHKGKFVNDTLAFERVNFTTGAFNVIYYDGNSGPVNLLVPSTDYPAIADMDGDGDLDILSFNQSGFKVDYFQNQSVERGYGLDSLEFTREDNCWGQFAEDGVTVVIDLGPDENSCASAFTDNDPKGEVSHPKHAGSTISIMDINGDGAAEAFLGDISYNNITKLDNGGASTVDAWMNDQDNAFPSSDVPVDISVFPASFFIDLDNDGLTDFIAASHNIGNTEDYESVWFYKNTGTSTNMQFELQTKSAIVESGIDFGSGAHPVFIDENADGLLDIVVGNFSYFVEGGDNDSRLFLLRNIGSTTAPAFELVDSNWLDFKKLNPEELNFSPTFGDIDMDGDMDLLVGSESGQVHLARNTAGANQPMTFDPIETNFAAIDIGVGAAPFLFDINDDGFADLLIGERSGNANLFVNQGAGASIEFNSVPDEGIFGMFDVRDFNGFGGRSTPVIVEIENELRYFLGSESGNIFEYKDVSLIDNSSTLVTSDFGDIRTGWNTHPAVTDIDNDGKMDMLVGNQRGGLTLYGTSMVSNTVDVIDLESGSIDTDIYPNPSKGFFNIDFHDEITKAQLEVYAADGQLIMHQHLGHSNTVDLKNTATGVYVLKITTDQGVYSKRILKIE